MTSFKLITLLRRWRMLAGLPGSAVHNRRKANRKRGGSLYKEVKGKVLDGQNDKIYSYHCNRPETPETKAFYVESNIWMQVV